MQARSSKPLVAVCAFVCLLVCALEARAQTSSPQCPLPEPTGYYKFVTDEAGVIDQNTRERLAAILNNLKERADVEFAVVTVRTTGDLSIFDYSLRLARCWGIGSKEGEKNALLMVVAVDDRKYFTQVSRHLEGDLPDGLVGTIQRRALIEPFRKGDYARGVLDAVQVIVATLADKRGFSVEGIDQSLAYKPQASDRTSRTRRRSGGLGFGACCLIAIVVIVIIAFSSKGGGRGRGGWGGGGGLLNALLLANVLSSLGGRGSSGWGGGSSSGWGGGGGGSSGWSGGGFGGFGGGGDFGGGGSGGSW